MFIALTSLTFRTPLGVLCLPFNSNREFLWRAKVNPKQQGLASPLTSRRNRALLKECPNSVLLASINMSLLRSEDEYLARTRLRLQLEATGEIAFVLL